MRNSRLGLVVVGICLLNPVSAQTQIYKCTDVNGGAVYSQLPCPAQESADSDDTEPEAKAESPENPAPVSAKEELSATEVPQEEPEPETDGSACKKRYRDEIDAIDAEIRRDYSPDKAEQYKQRLLELTRKLRQC